MQIIPILLKELEQEAQTTRKMLSRVPDEKLDWRPHPRSMTVRQLTTHIAELPSWIAMGLTTDGLDFNDNSYTPTPVKNMADVLETFEKSLEQGRTELEKATEPLLLEKWTMRKGETIYNVYTKEEVVRVSLSQTIHHRAQLGVFLRLLDIPIPGSYGPSADETW